jgi:ribonuclease HI
LAHWDAVVDRRTGRLCLGVILRDNEGRLIATKSTTRMGYVEPVAAEAFTAVEAIKLVRDIGFQHVSLMGDTKLVIDVVNY